MVYSYFVFWCHYLFFSSIAWNTLWILHNVSSGHIDDDTSWWSVDLWCQYVAQGRINYTTDGLLAIWCCLGYRILQDTFLINILILTESTKSHQLQHLAAQGHCESPSKWLCFQSLINELSCRSRSEAEVFIWCACHFTPFSILFFPSPAYLHHRSIFSCSGHEENGEL